VARVKFTVAIDGPAAAGKGTISKGIAAHFGFAHLDTGLLYRAVGRLYLEGADPVAAAKALTPGDLQRDDLRTPAVAQAASQVAKISEVRMQLVDFQREFSERNGGAVLDGRDIGTVICPTADVKLFVTARANVRAQRRFEELRAKGSDVKLQQVQNDVRERDARDSGRENSPTRQADDAVLLDTSDLTIEQALAAAVKRVEVVLRQNQS
jgi:cytidylate kinase